jgi:hypothetical protein
MSYAPRRRRTARGRRRDSRSRIPPHHPLPRATPSHPPRRRIRRRRRGRRQTGTPRRIPHLPPPHPPVPSSSAIECQRESQRKPRHVRPLVRAQDADREVGRIVARRRSRSNDRLPRRRHRRRRRRRRSSTSSSSSPSSSSSSSSSSEPAVASHALMST